MSKEIWKDIPGYEGLYQASNLGRVKSIITRGNKKPGIMFMRLKGKGYIDTSLTDKEGKRRVYYLHRLVASAFLGFDLNTNMKDNVIMHIDNNPSNNYLWNLKVGTQSENTHQCISEKRGTQFGRKGKNHGYSKLTEEDVLNIRRYNKEGIGYRKLSKIYNVSNTNIADIVHRRIWKHI